MTEGRPPRALVVVSLEPWDDVWRRNQHLVSRLLRDDAALHVLFVEPPRDVSLALLRRERPRPGRGLRRGPGERLWLYEPTKWLPRRVDPGFDVRRARRVLRTVVRRFDDRWPTVWVNDLGGVPFLDAVSGGAAPGKVLYDVTDDWLAAARPAAELDRLRRWEDDLLARADVVTVCSPALAEGKGARRRSARSQGTDPVGVVLVRNGVDVEAYRRPGPRPSDMPSGPVALYAGTLHPDRLDVELCVATAGAMRAAPAGATLVLVGPALLAADDVARLRSAGVVLAGPRPYDQIPAYLTHADVLVVPHHVDAFTDSLDPIKLYEYLAAGRPVVSTPVSGFRDARATLGSSHVTAVPPDRFPRAVATVLDAAPVPAVLPPEGLPTWDAQAVLMREALGY
ncbi:glycosyltransferase [Isoptericola sp. NPDC019482]|uniref:glycosyltransferase n=1 Tax=Isoptericola sp. NPDC019482 TaxID=3154688 RepID=UPI0034701C7B